MSWKYVAQRRDQAKLSVERTKAQQLLVDTLERGRRLSVVDVGPTDTDALRDLQRRIGSWDDSTLSILENVFDNTG